MNPRSRFLITLTALAIVVCACAGIAAAESAQNKNLIVSLQGRITPYALPRDELAPITVHMGGGIKTDDGATPPALRKISFALNRNGQLDTRGLPTCDSNLLESTTTAQARARCGPALIGHGNFKANVTFPSLVPFPAEGTLLAFNARVGGKPAILLHIYGPNPVQHTFVLPMTISHQATGTYGTVISAKIPRLAAGLGYVTSVNFAIGRQFQYKGKTHSLLSASCSAPAGFPGAIFLFAKGTFTFANGQTLSPRLIRDCKVRT
jgi:hypothetical protein